MPCEGWWVMSAGVTAEPDAVVPARAYVPPTGWVAGKIALRGHMLHVLVGGPARSVDLRSVQGALGRWVSSHSGIQTGSVLYLQSAAGALRVAGDCVLLPAGHYRCQDAESYDLLIRADDFEELLHQLEIRGLRARPVTATHAGYRDAHGQAATEPLVIRLRRGPLGFQFVAASFIGIVLGPLVGFYLGGWLFDRQGYGALVGVGVALAMIMVRLVHAARSLTWRVRRLSLVGREMQLQTADGTNLMVLRADEATVRCYNHHTRYSAGPPVMGVELPGVSKPMFFAAADYSRIRWSDRTESRRDWHFFGYILTAPEFRAVASGLGAPEDLTISDM